MAKDKDIVLTEDAPDAFSKLAKAIVDANNDGKIKKIPFGRQRINTPFNPTGKRGRRLARTVMQNGVKLNVKMLTDEEIALLAKIKPGRYIHRLVQIVQTEDDISGEQGGMDIRYKCKTADQRMALGSRIGNFAGMLKMIIAEHEQNEINSKAALRAAVA